jgi:hypothetical protein
VATPVHGGGGAGVPRCSRWGTKRVGDEEERVYYFNLDCWAASAIKMCWLLVLSSKIEAECSDLLTNAQASH